MKTLVITSLFFFQVSLLAQEKIAAGADNELLLQKSNYQINDKMKAGNFLIFNCERGYYACVDQDSEELCQTLRNDALSRKLASYPCAPLKKFTTKEECIVKNYEVVEAVAKKRFCYPQSN